MHPISGMASLQPTKPTRTTTAHDSIHVGVCLHASGALKEHLLAYQNLNISAAAHGK